MKGFYLLFSICFLMPPAFAQQWGVYPLDQLPDTVWFDVKPHQEEALFQLAEEYNWFVGDPNYGFYPVRASKASLERIGSVHALGKIAYDPPNGRVLTDSSRFHTRTDAVHSGVKLPKGYKGKGVLMGFVDTGIDFYHEDFLDSAGNTRVLYLWDQRMSTATNTPTFGYGQLFDSTAINDTLTGHTDPNNQYGHGTGVIGIGAGDGSSVPDSVADYKGYAPEASIVVVATDFNRSNWTQSVADAVEFVFHIADTLGVPCVVNLSLGTYLGSHDGRDVAARRIDSLVSAKPGRAVVAAAGNSGHLAAYHLRHEVLPTDTAFSVLSLEAQTSAGSNAVFSEGWVDMADKQLLVNVCASDTMGNAASCTNFPLLSNIQGALLRDTLTHPVSGLPIGVVEFYSEELLGVRQVQFRVANPDSSHYQFAVRSTGEGTIDFWSGSWLGLSNVVSVSSLTHLPNNWQLNYKDPNKEQSMVSSWACSPEVITVGNMTNRTKHPNYDGGFRYFNSYQAQSIYETSSRGPARTGITKPNIIAPGNSTICPARNNDVNFLLSTPSLRYKLANGGKHIVLGGTSAAAPAVSGIVALAFERCATISHQTLIQGFEQSAYTDVHTGTVPNVHAGFGKVDATGLFAWLNSPGPIVSASGSNALCAGKLSLGLNAVQATNVQWGTGQSTQQIVVQQPDEYWANYHDLNTSCFQVSDTFQVISNPNPTLTLGNDSVVCKSPAFEVISPSWLTYTEWNGMTTNTVEVTQEGLYVLYGKDAFNCEVRDTVSYSFVETSELLLDSLISACSGESIRLEAASGFTQFQWSNSSTKPHMSTTAAGTYFVTALDTQGCEVKDTVLVTLRKCTVGQSEEQLNSQVLVQPNGRGWVLSHPNWSEGQSLRVFNAQGQEVWSGATQREATTIVLPNTAAGVYFIQAAKQHWTKRVWYSGEH